MLYVFIVYVCIAVCMFVYMCIGIGKSCLFQLPSNSLRELLLCMPLYVMLFDLQEQWSITHGTHTKPSHTHTQKEPKLIGTAVINMSSFVNQVRNIIMLHTYMHTFTHTHTHTHVHAYTLRCIHNPRIHVTPYICCTLCCAYAYIHIHKHIHTHTYIHTHIHIHAYALLC